MQLKCVDMRKIIRILPCNNNKYLVTDNKKVAKFIAKYSMLKINE